jgi:glycosyltransferase involved in cell wall biosynthesis
MKIAIVLNTSWNIYNFRMGLVRALQAQGHEVHTIAPVDKYSRHLLSAGCVYHPLKMDARGASFIKDFALTVELAALYRKIKPAVVLHYTIKPNVYGSLAAAICGIPAINNVCELGTIFLTKNLVSIVAMVLYKISFLFPKKVFFQNEEDLAMFVDRRLVSERKADLLPGSGVNLGKFKAIEFRRNFDFTFLMVSRLIIDKGVFEFVEAAKILKAKGVHARFQLLGAKDAEHKRGTKSAIIDEWVQNGVIEYLGTTDDVRPYLAKADCVVLPSYREGTPRCLLEAAALSKPVVATDVPGCRQVVIDGFNGLRCQLKNAADLAQKMERMAGFDDATLRQFGRNGRWLIEQEYDENIVIGKYLEAINHLSLRGPEKLWNYHPVFHLWTWIQG